MPNYNQTRSVTPRLRTAALSLIISLALFDCGGGGGGGGGGNDGGGGSTANSVTAIAGCDTTPQSNVLTGTLDFAGGNPNEQLFSLVNPQPQNGTVELLDATTGAYRYTPFSPQNGVRGVDTFGFRVDSPNNFDTAIQTIIVHPAIMPLGDSITRGAVANFPSGSQPPGPQNGGFRAPLFNLLIGAGFSDPDTNGPAFDFVGSNNVAGSGIAGFDSDNEGHGGYWISDVTLGDMRGSPRVDPDYTGIFDALEDNPADIILLHAGTNDFIGSNSVAQARSDLEFLLSEINRWEITSQSRVPVTLYLARIIDFNPPSRFGDDTAVTLYNAMVEAVATACTNGSNPSCPDTVAVVDMQSAFEDGSTGMPNPQFYSDEIHPDEVDNGAGISGYSVMARVWFNSVRNADILAKCP